MKLAQPKKRPRKAKSVPNGMPDLTPAAAIAVLTDPVKLQAKDLYLSHASKSEISRALGVSTKTVAKWIKDGEWATEREDEDRGIIESAFAARKLTVAKLARTTADQLVRAVDHLVARKEPPNLQEAEKLSLILSNLDRIGRLDAGTATDNIAVIQQVKMTIEDVRAEIAKDPFREIDVPVVPVE